jgi:hypothetical protein
MLLNGEGSGRHPPGDASYLNLDTVLNEQGSGHHILSNALHRRLGVVKNEQGSSHLTRRMRRLRKLAEPSRLHVGTWNVGSLTGKLREIVDTMIKIPEGAKGEGGGRYRIHTLVHRHYDKQEWSRHCAQ